jgi:N-acetylglucosaminyl-diphospho-decaprenol L-rhamnosyltransferase
MPTLSIVMVNWNGKDFILNALSSIENSIKESFTLSKVVMVDNCSSDDSIALIKSQKFSFHIEFILNKGNFGYAKACNQGAMLANSDYILFLNPDVVLDKDALTKVFTYINKNQDQRLGAVTIKQVDQFSQTIKSCNRLPQLRYYVNSVFGLSKLFPSMFYSIAMNEWDHETNRVVEDFMGAFCLMKKNIFDEVDGFSEEYFLYSTDADLCYRLKQKNYYAYYYASVSMIHKVSSTTEHIKATRYFYWLEGIFIYAKKYFSKLDYVVLFFLFMVIRPVTYSIFMLTKGRVRDVLEMMKAHKKFLKSNKKISVT